MIASPSTTDSIARPQGNGVYLIDTLYLRPGLAASHLVVDEGRRPSWTRALLRPPPACSPP